jgi:hypothetical protein
MLVLILCIPLYHAPLYMHRHTFLCIDTSIRDNDDVANMFEVHRNLQVAKSIEINVIVEDGIQHHDISTPIQNPYTHEYPYTQEYPTQQSTPIQNPYTPQTRRIPQRAKHST